MMSESDSNLVCLYLDNFFCQTMAGMAVSGHGSIPGSPSPLIFPVHLRIHVCVCKSEKRERESLGTRLLSLPLI